MLLKSFNHLILSFVQFVCRSLINGTRRWSVWWPTSVKPSSTRRNSSTSSSNARTRFRRVSRSDSTPKCQVASRRWCSTRLRSWAAWVCCPWVTCSSRSLTSSGPSRRTWVSRITAPAWATTRTSSYPISTGQCVPGYPNIKMLQSCIARLI